jgi:rubrerythrin
MDFSKFEDVVKFAIKKEEAAYRAYGELKEMAKTPGLQEMLADLQAEEKNHKKLLQDVSESKIKDIGSHHVIDLKISDFLSEEPPSSDMTFQDLLILAAKKEQEAVDLYSGMKDAAGSDELTKLFDFLIEQERSHKLKLETEYEKYVLGEG